MATINAATATDIGSNSYNQDRGGVLDCDGGSSLLGPGDARAKLLTVFDGHGTYGEEIAVWAQEYFQSLGSAAATTAFAAADAHIYNRLKDYLRTIDFAFTERDGALYGAMGAPVRGGTTASVVHVKETGAMTAAHVGDSDIRYWDEEGEGVSLCADHSVTSVAEHSRVSVSHPATQFVFSSPGGITTRPVFIRGALNPLGGFQHCDVRKSWSAYMVVMDHRGGREQLAMTRALGDYNLQRGGLISAPHVVEVEAPAAGVTRAIVLASDGLWDTADYTEVGRIVLRPEFLETCDAAGATAAVLAFGLERARAVFGAGGVDNITATVAYVRGLQNVTGGLSAGGGSNDE